MNQHELAYRKTGEQLVYLFVGWMPSMGVVLYLNVKLFPRSTWPFGVIAALYMAVMIMISIQRMLAYYKWKK